MNKYVLVEDGEDRTLVRKEMGGTYTCPLPGRDGFRVGYWIKPTPYDGTLKWEWVITNMNVTVVTGMSSGYTRTRFGARLAVRRALRFWNSLGYDVVPEEDVA
jgi:hypothetical protein